jgi:GT2 family glycosyltransferase
MIDCEQEHLQHSNTTVCVAIPTYNREQVLIDTLEQVRAQDPPADEIVVVDQTLEHERETDEYLTRADKEGRIRWVKQQPPSLPGARNRVLRETQCEVVIFIDDDVKLSQGFIGHHLRNFSDPDVDAVAGRIIQPKGYRYPNGRRSWPHLLDYLYFHLNGTERVEGIASFGGGNHAVRMSVLKAIGGYDENYIGWAYREDSDAAIRIWKSGGLIVFDPQAELTHLATPGGGCRIKSQGSRTPEWQVSFPASYFACRHLYPTKEFWKRVFIKDFRKYALRYDTVFWPWRLPVAVASYVYAICRAALLTSGPVRSPFAETRT